MLQAIIWYGAALVVAAGALAVLQARAAKRLRAEPANAAGILYRFSRRAGWVMFFAFMALIVLSLMMPGFGTAGEQVRGVVGLAVALVVLALGFSWMRLGLEGIVRRPEWSRTAMMRVHFFFDVPMLGTMLIAALGEGLTIIAMERFGGAPPPAWTGALWVFAAFVAVMLLPTGRLLGRGVEAPADLVEQFNACARMSDPPPLVMLDTGGAQYVNAFAFWRPGRWWVAVGDGLVAAMTREQTLAILMHELGHVVHRDPRRQFLVHVAFQAVGTGVLMWFGAANLWTALMVLAFGAVLVVSWFSRRAEHRCDLFAAERTDPQVMASALRRLHELNFQPARHDKGHRDTHPDLAHRLEALGVQVDPPEVQKPLSRGRRRALAWMWLLLTLPIYIVLLGMTLHVFQRETPLWLWIDTLAIIWLAYFGTARVYHYTSRADPRRLPPWIAAAMSAYWPAMYGLVNGMQAWLLVTCSVAIVGGVWVLMVRLRASARPPRRAISQPPRTNVEPVTAEHGASE